MPINIIKVGGNVIDNPDKLAQFLSDFSSLKGDNVLVHGGGKVATEMAEKLGVKTRMLEGRRLTDEPMRDIVSMVYGGLINKKIVAGLQTNNCNALGLSGADGASVLSKKRVNGEVDYGYVGDIESVNTILIEMLLNQSITPIFAPLSFNKNFGILNTNADSMAAAIASALATNRMVNLIYCFEKNGVLSDPKNEDSVIPFLNMTSYKKYKKEGVINEGMIPKLDNAFSVLKSGVKKVIICNSDDLKKAVESGKSGTSIQ